MKRGQNCIVGRLGRRLGFTMVELMTVVIIIALLIGLLIPVIGRVRQTGYETATNQEIDQIVAACNHYYDDFQAYPGPVSNSDIEGYDDTGLAVQAPPSQPDITNVQQANYPGAIGTTSSRGRGPITLATYYPDGRTRDINGNSIAPVKGSVPVNFTASQNLVLGLLGGLWRNPNANLPDSGELEYVNGVNGGLAGPGVPATLIGTGPQALVPSTVASYKQFTPYLDASFPGSKYLLNGDGSPETGQAPFQDIAGRYFSDCDVPVFTDQFPDHMPILYIRARVGAHGILSGPTSYASSGTTVGDPTTNPQNQPAHYNYDLRELTPYTWPSTGPNTPTAGTGTNRSGGILITSGQYVGIPQHGLQGVSGANGPSYLVFIGQKTPASLGWNHPVPTNTLDNGAQYFMNPSVPPTAATSNLTNAGWVNATGTPRNKDGFILISAGRDRAYGTADDITNFGSVEP